MTEIVDNKFMEDLLEVEDYAGGVLSSALERAAGNKLSGIDSDGEFEEKLQETERHDQNCYYHVAYRYKLPTIRILPFLLRLITL